MATVAVITVSDRSARGERPDTGGPLLASLLAEQGHPAAGPVTVVPDDAAAVAEAVRAARGRAQVVLTTGGTGLSPRDITPEAVGPLLDRTVPGLIELLRADALSRLPTAALSRGVAGVSAGVLVVTVPGSTGAVRDAARLLGPLLDHAVEQIAGGDHVPGGGVPA
jgi:molybdenum cofactor synthesis domain-containing protein